MLNSLKNFIKKVESERLIKENEQVEQARTLLFNSLSKFVEAHPKIKNLTKSWDRNNSETLALTADQLEKVQKDIPQKTLEILSLHKIVDIKTEKGLKDIFFNFFGMDETWPLWRNTVGLLMVHSPEYPTYFIPAYSQAKATGEAKDLKKGEGPRGIITGALEGIAVGALVSGRVLKPKEMGPYVALGIGLQMVSCTIFPWLGEKMGARIYKKNLENGSQSFVPSGLSSQATLQKTNENKTIADKPQVYAVFKGIPRGNMRI